MTLLHLDFLLIEFLEIMGILAKLAAGLGAIFSAVYWLKSSDAKVPPRPDEERPGFKSATITLIDGDSGPAELAATLKEQSRLSAIAARWAAIAAIGVAVSTLLDFSR